MALDLKKQMFDSLNVGDIIYDSWGYSMTIVSFYQVMEKKGTATLIIRELNNKSVSGDGFSGKCVAVKDSFRSDELITKRVTARGYIKLDSQELSKWDGQAKYFNRLD